MVFSSLLFLLRFLPVVLALYYAAPKKLRNFVLFVVSIVFYAWGEPKYVVLILFSTVLDYTAGRLVHHFKGKNQKSRAKIVVFFSVFLNLALLGFFKYADFFVEMLNGIGGFYIEPLHVMLPIGISFYTFQTMSYTIDVYRGDAEVQKNFVNFGAFVALFPQLIAGPIIRYKTVAEQLNSRKESFDLFHRGALRFCAGLGKKVLLANQFGELWNEIAGLPAGELTVAMAWLGVISFTLQIYFDFSGYSDMAIGLGNMFGFEFQENFNYPYESKSVTEFWRKWHISLSTWFKEYVYIPLGGNRRGAFRHILNIAIVWTLTGLWHGAAWCFVLWGVYYGLLLIIEKYLLAKILKKLPCFVSRIYTIVVFTFGWSIFSWPDMADNIGFTKAMFGFGGVGLIDRQTLFYIVNYGVVILVGIIGSTSIMKRLKERFLPEQTYRGEICAIVFVVLIFVSSTAMLVNSSYNPFLYFRF